MGKIFIRLAIAFGVLVALHAAAEPVVVAEDGAWCWFADPRAVHADGVTYVGWVTSRGNVEVTAIRDDGSRKTVTIREKLNRDDHANPALMILPDGRLLVVYSKHNGKEMFARTCVRPKMLEGWSDERVLSIHEEPRQDFQQVTYPNLVRLADEDDAIYLFWRGDDWKPTWARSMDFGDTWEPLGTIVSRPGAEGTNRPYVKIATNGDDAIHMAFTDGHPRNEPTNSIYYARYREGHFERADGQVIAAVEALPFDPVLADRVYDGASQGRAWIWDVAEDSRGQPRIVFTRHPEETDHRYMFARWTGEDWFVTELCAAGGWFPQTPEGRTEREPHYSGGIVLDHANPNVVYLSRERNGAFNIERWTTEDGGETWASIPITTDSVNLNVRPFVVRDRLSGDSGLLWMHGSYTHYTKFETKIVVRAGALNSRVRGARVGLRSECRSR